MRKITLTLLALLFSTNVLAQSTDLGSAVANSLRKQSTNNTLRTLPIIYGGKDISRPVVATADESVWAGEPKFID